MRKLLYISGTAIGLALLSPRGTCCYAGRGQTLLFGKSRYMCSLHS